MDVGAAAGEDVAERPGGADAVEEDEASQHDVVLAEDRPAEPVVDQPAQHQETQPDGDGLGSREGHYGRIDQRDLGAVVIDEAEQEEAGDQGRIGFPLEPVQLGRQALRRHGELLGRVETAAMDGPDLAADAFGGVGRVERLVQVVVEPDEIEGGADPGDAHDHVSPAQQQIQPVHDKSGVHPPSYRLAGHGLKAVNRPFD